MIEVNGAIGEGREVVLRTALALSAIGRMLIHIYNICAKRAKPGLSPNI
jgi:RNA 3'-terminal phosphate cyclase